MTAIEETKNLAELPLDELIGNFKVYDVTIRNFRLITIPGKFTIHFYYSFFPKFSRKLIFISYSRVINHFHGKLNV